MIRKVSAEKLSKAIEEWEEGSLEIDIKMYAKEGESWVALNNVENSCWVEEFDTEEETIRWLNRW